MNIKKVLKVVLIIVLVVIAIIAIYILRNYIIISKISNKQKELANKTNYYYKMEAYRQEEKNDDTTVEYYYYYKDGKGIEKYGNQKNGYYIEWFDNNTKERITIDTSKATAKIYKGEKRSFMLPTLTFDKSTVKDKLEDSFSYISYEEINGKKCYKIKPFEGIISNLYYINVEDGTWARISMGNIKGNESNIRILDYIDCKYDELTDEDVKKPDLTGYEVMYYNENGELEEVKQANQEAEENKKEVTEGEKAQAQEELNKIENEIKETAQNQVK